MRLEESTAINVSLVHRAVSLALPALLALASAGCGRAAANWPSVPSVTCAVGGANARFGAPGVTVGVGGAARLRVPGVPPSALRWTSSSRNVADVYRNGHVVALSPGTAYMNATWNGGAGAQCVVSVIESFQPTVNAATLRQHPDERRFEVNGRTCYGSELNGQPFSSQEERNYAESNRVINPQPLNGRQRLEWQVEEGTEVYDGAGVLMGTVATRTMAAGGAWVSSSKFNYGMSKVLGGRLCLYAFAVRITPSPAVRRLAGAQLDQDGTVATSAWLPLDRVVQREALLDRIGLGKVKMPRLPLESRGLTITGGDPSRYMTEYGELRVVKNPDAEPVPSHYLRRPSGTVNIIYSVPGFGLGGQGLDSFLVTDGVVFYPALGAKVFTQPTYYPGRHPRRGQVSDKTITFIYGAAVARGTEPVYGWVAREALQGY